MTILPLGGRRILTPMGRSWQRAAAGGGWWDLYGTITNCVWAYQPKGAASYAASKVNLANPGTYDATEVIQPPWSSDKGWYNFNSNSSYLLTGYNIPLNQTHSLIARYANYAGGYFGGIAYTYIASPYLPFGFYIFTSVGTKAVVGNKNYVSSIFLGGGTVANGVLALSQRKFYFNKSLKATIASGTSGNTVALQIGRIYSSSYSGMYCDLEISAIALYSGSIEGYVNDLTDEVNAL